MYGDVEMLLEAMIVVDSIARVSLRLAVLLT